jgi:isopentenyl-diphosphate Delta-isomerase
MKTTDDQNEMFIVVDQNDRVLGYRKRSECHHDKTLIHRSVGVLIYDDQGRLLLQKRSLTKDTDAGKWGISAAGHVRKGQTYRQAIERELKEELGVKLPLKKVKKRILATEKETEIGQLYEAHSNGPFQPDTTEVDRIEFFPLEILRQKVKSGMIKLSACTRINLVDAGIVE